MIASGAQAEFNSPLRSIKGTAEKGLKVLNRAIAPFDLHFEVAALRRRVQVVNRKRPRRDKGFR